MHRVAEESRPLDKAMEEDENEISLNQLGQSNDGISVNTENADYFPFSALPDELIDHTFSFLSIKDRIRARVNRRLDKIELTSKHYVQHLRVWEGSEAHFTFITGFSGQHIYFIHGKSYSSDCIRRLTRNTSIGYLEVQLTGSDDFHRDICNLIKDFDVDKIGLSNGPPAIISWTGEQRSTESIVDSFFLDLARKSCKEMYLGKCDNVSGEALYQVYKMMMEGSTNLRHTSLTLTKAQCISFLGLIGITYRDHQFYSRRNIQAREFCADDEWATEDDYTSLFDGMMEICVFDCIWTGSLGGYFSFELHETRESLENAKNRHPRINVIFE